MKKVITLICILIAGYTMQSHALSAQEKAAQAPVQLDEKTQKKVDKATLDLAKDKQKLHKCIASNEKAIAKHEKDHSNGKLSPNDVVKEKKSQEKAQATIEKLNKSIAKNQAYLDSFKPK